MCNGLRKDAQRDECRNKIKKVLSSSVGSVGVVVFDQRLFARLSVPTLLWFCPSGECHKFPSRKVTGMPPMPTTLPVLVGTNLSKSEVRFLVLCGFSFGGLHPGTIPLTQGLTCPSPLDLRIDVNSYLKRVNSVDPNY